MNEQNAPIQQLANLLTASPDELDRRFALCDHDLRRLVLALVKEYPDRRNALGKFLGDHLGVGYLNLAATAVQPEVVALIPRDYARQHQVCAIYQLGDVVTLACAQPEDMNRIMDAMQRFSLVISPVFSFPDEIEDTISIHYHSQNELENQLHSAISYRELLKNDELTTERLMALSGETYIVDLCRNLLLMAVTLRASDIHIEPAETYARIRFRIDGVLQDRLRFEPGVMIPLTSRLKILAHCDISERRLPQDGRIKIELNNRSIDYRFSAVPTIYGEKIVLRVLGSSQKKSIPPIEDLACSPEVEAVIREAVRAPNGVFFITGPTGSGKTTTLYSLLQHINESGINIMTIEDPVEYRLEGANQVQVNTATHLDFAKALRAFLRQDPDVILIGEIRDVESARIASQAALTGHLVFATMHTNNALQAVSRLVEIGVEPFLVAPSLIAVMGQRLVRRICPKCKEAYTADPETIEANFTGWDGHTPVTLHRGKGCAHCQNTGYYGRLGVHEIFLLNKEVRELIAHNASILTIEDTARAAGFKPLRYDGLKKMLRGLTTLEEIDRISYSVSG